MEQTNKKSKKHAEKAFEIIIGSLMDFIVGLILMLIGKII